MKEVLYDFDSGVIAGVLLVSMTVAAVVMPNSYEDPHGQETNSSYERFFLFFRFPSSGAVSSRSRALT